MPIVIGLGLFLAVALLFVGLALPSGANPVRERLTQYGSRARTLEAIDVLTISVEAGLSLDGGMAKVSEKMDNELSRAFARVTTDVRVGRPRREALRDMADRAGVADLTNFVTALVQAEQLGVSMTK